VGRWGVRGGEWEEGVWGSGVGGGREAIRGGGGRDRVGGKDSLWEERGGGGDGGGWVGRRD